MSKELEYEINNFANLLHKDCMNLMEALKKQDKDNKAILYVGRHFKKVILPYEEYQKMCNRLESINNINPSEALEIVDKMANYILLDEEYGFIDDKEKQSIIKDRDTIKQALLKAQEPKHYLKWEDLEFDASTSIKVKMGDTQYSLSLRRTRSKGNSVVLRDDDLIAYLLLYEKDKQFFNNLHLERVEE